MKRIIKSSYGLNDDSWMYPEEESIYTETHYTEIALVDVEIEVNGGAIEYITPFDYSDIYDAELGVEILDANEVQDCVEETILDDIDADGTYIVNGVVTIPYDIDVPTKGNLPRRDWEELVENCDFAILYNEITFTGTIS